MAYRIYRKLFCDVPGCSAQAEGLGDRGDVVRPDTWYPGKVEYNRPVQNAVPTGWVFLPLTTPLQWRPVGVFRPAGLWACPKHVVESTVDGVAMKDLLESREAAMILMGKGKPR